MATPSIGPLPGDDESAIAYAATWSERARVLDAERLRKLRALTEHDAVNLVTLLSRGRISPPASTSGLVAQQRIFDLLR
ncbi:MAG: hypothetical protein WBR29_01105 [Gammaproteobacteria bacterium]